MTTPLRIAIVGAESTGKTRLVADMATHFRNSGRRVIAVAEALRDWCEQAGRTPHAEEQAGIAQAQAAAVDAAASTAGVDTVLADTTPLMVAVYSDLLFADRSLYPFALDHQRRYTLTLLTGLDLPWVADGLQRDGPHVREPVDARVRAALDSAAITYQVVYGQGEERLQNALYAIYSIAKDDHPERTSRLFDSKNGLQVWSCDTCSDPDCEHRLFTGLLRG